ncbi:MAG: rod shape-determining protein MreD [Treponemataceae bacterium]|nr:rod shape-determining protein MreD [Treponemataceae bacterium]
MKNIVEHFAFILVFLFLEAAVLSNITFFPVLPDFLLILTLYAGLNQDCIAGETNGFVSGLLLDFLSASPLGLNGVIRTLIGFLSGIFSQTINISGFFIPCLIGGLATLIKALLTGFTAFFFPNAVYTYDIISPLLWQETLCNMVFTPILFQFFRHFSFFEPGERAL